jgi:glycosyltransferase involved in cell wall biosynthesis
MLLILINATAVKSSGSLTILKDFIAYIESISSDKTEYHLCTVVDDFDSVQKVHIHKLRSQNWLSRIKWDNGGLRKWCIRMNIKPDLIISLQNTSTKYSIGDGKYIPQLVYYHQLLPLVSYRWNIFNRQEFILFLYAYFYSFFVVMNSKSSYYVVQLPYIRELFLKKFRKIDQDKVSVICPNKPLIDITTIPEISLDRELFTFLYPATALKYKNHNIIIQALVLLQQRRPSVLNNIRIFFTVEKLDSRLMKSIRKNNLSGTIQLIGQKSYSEILSYYKSVDALLFPSQIESFGLPLVEASCFGLPVIASDLPYAHEVLESYPNKIFVGPKNTNDWADAIQNHGRFEKMILPPPHMKNSWETFFNLADRILNDTSTQSRIELWI